MKKNRKPPPPPPPSQGGKGTAAARQMGLLLDFSSENMMASDEEDNQELKAEFLAIVGGQPDPKQKPNGKTPLPMEAIERMAALCMKDLDEENGVEEEDLEDDELMAELMEVLEEDDKAPDTVVLTATKEHDAPAPSSASESILLERLAMYKVAVANAKQAGESSKMRRYERGLKTLENLLTSVRKGKKIDEDETPPPVITGKNSNCQQAAPLKTTPTSQPPTPEKSEVLTNYFTPEPPAAVLGQLPSKSSPVSQLPPNVPPAKFPKPKISPSTVPPLTSPEAPSKTSAPTASSLSSDAPNPSTQAALQARVREYKLAALHSKQEGDIEMATRYYRLAKSFEPILDSLDKGETVDLSTLPPPPDQLSKEMLSSHVQHTPVATATSLAQAITHPTQAVSRAAERPAPPRDMMEALQQRMNRYKTAAAQAKSRGEDRKARMHERIVKQYQEAIKAHKAGKPVEFSDLPVPPGFPSIQGMESLPAHQSLGGILETALKLANEDEDAEETKKPDTSPASTKPAPSVQPKLPHQPDPQAALAAAKPASIGKSAPKMIAKAQQQLTFLENRKKQLKQAALRAKQQNDIEGAKLFLCQAKGLDPMIEASQSGLPVDISKVPPTPMSKEEFMLVQRSEANISPATAVRYTELVKLMRQQHEMCISYSKQFTHLGNITETIKFEKMAEDCKKDMEILKQAHAKGFPLPKYHYEQRTFSVIRIFPELNSNDMLLSIVKGINLPAPPGISPDDLDAFVRFEFPYPNAEKAQKDKTSVIKNSNCPEFQENFKLYINRSHRGFKRAIQSKGIKFEVVHKGGLFKNDRVVGTAQLKLETLEMKCELREILELLNGRRPTGGRLEVIVRLREPLTSQQLETTTEKWLVIDPLAGPPAVFPKPKPAVAPVKDAGSSKPVCSLQSLSILAFDKERLEKKMVAYNQASQPPPSDLVEQHQNIIQKINWQKSQLQHGGAAVMKEYLTQLGQYQQRYTEAARRLGNDGKREEAKDALYKRNLVEKEITGQLSPRLFRKLPPRVCVSLKSIVDEHFLCAGHIFLGFSKCGRYVLSYTSSSGDDDFSFYIYHLYWWEFNVHSKLKMVRQVRLFQDEEIYSDLYLTVCEWPSDSSKVIVFGFNTRSANGLLMNMMMSDENHRDIYISTVAMPPFMYCPNCRDMAIAHPGDPNAKCLQHGFMLHMKYQVVYPFPTFQPAFQLKKDQVVLLNTSYSLVACAVSVHTSDDSNFCQILYDRSCQTRGPVVEVNHTSLISHCPAGLEEGLEKNNCSCQSGTRLIQPVAVPPQDIDTHVSPAVAMAKEFVADIFRRAKEARGSAPIEEAATADSGFKCLLGSGALGQDTLDSWDVRKTLESCLHGSITHSSTSSGTSSISDIGSSPRESFIANFELESLPAEPGYVNYTKLRYVLEPNDSSEAEDEYEDDKISLPFVVTDLLGKNLKLLKEKAICQGQYLTVEQLTLDFEYVINEVIRNDASWSKQFCSFSDYDIVILEVCPETNQVIINIGLLLLAFPSPDEEGQLRPKTYHTSLKVAWDLNTGIFVTVSVGDLTEVKGQTSGRVWSSYRKSCVDMVMKWLVPESSVRYVNRMTNEALHKGCSLKFLADNERYTWIVL